MKCSIKVNYNSTCSLPINFLFQYQYLIMLLFNYGVNEHDLTKTFNWMFLMLLSHT
jgi:hypothetical protein